jgi:hypothetical protein
VLRNAWQVESRLAGRVRSIDAAIATLRRHNAGDAVGPRRAGLSGVGPAPFPGSESEPVSDPASALRGEAAGGRGQCLVQVSR